MSISRRQFFCVAPSVCLAADEGKGRTLTVQVTWRPNTQAALTSTTVIAATMTGGGTKLLAQPAITLDGYVSTFFLLEGRPTVVQAKPATRARRFFAIAELADVSGAGVEAPVPAPEAPGRLWLSLAMSCETGPQCDALSMIAQQSELLLTAKAGRLDGGAPTPY